LGGLIDGKNAEGETIAHYQPVNTQGITVSYNEHRYLSHDGLSLYYRDYGSGDNVVVCLPGLTRNSKDFEDLATHLAGRWRVLTPDLRGRGRSDHDPKPANYNAATYAADSWRLLDELGIRRVALIGTSLGGLVSMIMADQQPQRLRGVVVNDMGPDVPPAAVSRILQYVGRTPPAKDWAAAARDAKLNYGLAFPGLPETFWERHVRHYWKEDEQGRPVPDMDPAIGDALRKAYGALKILRWLRRAGLLKRVRGVPIDPWDLYSALTMPALLLRGELSDVLTEDTVVRMQRSKPDLEVVRVPDRGHAPLLDEPRALEAVNRFLTRLP
jgi:pimeloyl-ACP methyl ester carboxylesterase